MFSTISRHAENHFVKPIVNLKKVLSSWCPPAKTSPKSQSSPSSQTFPEKIVFQQTVPLAICPFVEIAFGGSFHEKQRISWCEQNGLHPILTLWLRASLFSLPGPVVGNLNVLFTPLRPFSKLEISGARTLFFCLFFFVRIYFSEMLLLRHLDTDLWSCLHDPTVFQQVLI